MTFELKSVRYAPLGLSTSHFCVITKIISDAATRLPLPRVRSYGHLQSDIEHFSASILDAVLGTSIMLGWQVPESKAPSDHEHVGI